MQDTCNIIAFIAVDTATKYRGQTSISFFLTYVGSVVGIPLASVV